MHRDLLVNEVLGDTVGAILGAPPTTLDGADGHGGLVVGGATVDVDDAELEAVAGNLVGVQHVLGPYRSHESVGAVVGERDGLVLVGHDV